MKTITNLTLATVLGLALCATTLAQGHPGGGRGRGPGPHGNGAQAGAPGQPPTPAVAAEHMSANYAALAPYDANKDWQLDEAELKDVAQAIADGTLQVPAHRPPPQGEKPQANRRFPHLADMFAQVAKYDADKNGTISGAELTALQTAIENGEIVRPGGPRGFGRAAGAHQPPQE